MNFTYFETPAFLSLALHIMTCIELPVHFFGAYCILFQTPDSMKTVKWSMLNLHFWSAFLDLTVSFLTTPYVLIPAMAGFPLGALKNFGVATEVQVYMTVTSLAVVGVATVSIFENRFFLLFAQNHWWRHIRKSFLIFNYLLALLFFVPPFLNIPDQPEALQIVFRQLPDIPAYIRRAPVFVFATDAFWCAFSCLAIMSVLIPAETVSFIGLLFLNMYHCTRRTNLSQHTFNLQLKFIRAICIQVSTPILILIGPMSYLGICLAFFTYHQAGNNICFIMMAVHGLSSTIVMLLVHKPYRDVCSNIFFFRTSTRSSLGSSAVENSQRVMMDIRSSTF